MILLMNYGRGLMSQNHRSQSISKSRTIRLARLKNTFELRKYIVSGF